jgi:hypothetical protein
MYTPRSEQRGREQAQSRAQHMENEFRLKLLPMQESPREWGHAQVHQVLGTSGLVQDVHGNFRR